MDEQQSRGPVVVGVDGSAEGLRATRWAAVEAARRKVELRVVTAFAWPQDHVVGQPGLGERYRDRLLEVAHRQLAAASVQARAASPDVTITEQLEVGAPIGVLGSEARRAQLVVLGDRGLGGLGGLILGSVAVALAARGACPVVIVRGERAEATGPVVVGIDGSPVSEAAIAFAFEAAATRRTGLVAVHTWWPTSIDYALETITDWDAVAVEEEAVLAERLAGWAQKYPDVAVRRCVRRDSPATVLVAASQEAQLVVVGSRGRGNATGLLLGSVSHAVLHRSACPVAIMRPDLAH